MTNIPALDSDDDNFEEEDASYSFRELMNLLFEKKDIIITVPTEELPALKKGLYSRKAADTQKLTKAGILASGDVLSFQTYQAVDDMGRKQEGATTVRIRLAQRKSVTILSIEIPDDTL